MPSFSDELLTLSGRTFRVLRGGEGPLVLFLHGFAVTADMWRPNLPAFIEAGYSVLAVDLPGHGDSFRPARPYRVADLASAVNDLLVGLGVEQLLAIGNSLGGAVASELALAYPAKVQKLALSDAFGFDPDLPIFRRARYWTDLLLPSAHLIFFGPTEWNMRRIQRMIYDCPDRLPPRTFVVRYSGGWLHNHWGRALVGAGVLWEMLTPARRRAFAQRRSALRAPTLLLWGEDDRLLPVAHAHHAQALIPGARLRLFPQCGHAPNIEYAEEFNGEVLRFFAEQTERNA